MSDVPIGVFLSGGVDSSYVSRIIANNLKNDINTFSLRFSNRWTDESNLAMLHASEIGSMHHEIIFNDTTLEFYLDKIYKHLDEPMANSSSSNTLYISCYARKFVKTVLTGEGVDELFGGYPWIYFWLIRSEFDDYLKEKYQISTADAKDWVENENFNEVFSKPWSSIIHDFAESLLEK